MAQIDEILMQAAKVNASDLHIGENTVPLVRIYGNLKPLYEMTDTAQGNIDFWKIVDSPCASQGVRFFVAETQSLFPDNESRMMRLFCPIMTEKQRFVLKDTGECDFAYTLPSGVRFRVNMYRSMGALNAAIRIIPDVIPSWQELRMPDALQRLAELKSGLVLITGVTGSGKSTTLAAILNEINRNRSAHILTLEDPVEFKFESVKSLIHQREIGYDSRSFATALRAALREDPDVIMVGELRDTETTAIAVTAAETGHLVFATLHTRNASETVNRIIDVFPEQQQKQIRIQLAGSLQAVVSQQLLPDKRGKRTAAFEIMVVTPALRNLIREGKTQQMDSYIQTGARYGMQTMEDAVAKLKREGKI